MVDVSANDPYIACRMRHLIAFFALLTGLSAIGAPVAANPIGENTQQMSNAEQHVPGSVSNYANGFVRPAFTGPRQRATGLPPMTTIAGLAPAVRIGIDRSRR